MNSLHRIINPLITVLPKSKHNIIYNLLTHFGCKNNLWYIIFSVSWVPCVFNLYKVCLKDTLSLCIQSLLKVCITEETLMSIVSDSYLSNLLLSIATKGNICNNDNISENNMAQTPTLSCLHYRTLPLNICLIPYTRTSTVFVTSVTFSELSNTFSLHITCHLLMVCHILHQVMCIGAMLVWVI